MDISAVNDHSKGWNLAFPSLQKKLLEIKLTFFYYINFTYGDSIYLKKVEQFLS